MKVVIRDEAGDRPAFKFDIGDVVRMAITSKLTPSKTPWKKGGYDDLRGHVIGRLLEECPNGIQAHYTVRFTNKYGDFTTATTRHHEIELVASEPFEPDKENKDASA